MNLTFVPAESATEVSNGGRVFCAGGRSQKRELTVYWRLGDTRTWKLAFALAHSIGGVCKAALFRVC